METIKGYQIEKVLGQGGFGKVYLVTKGGKKFALKEQIPENQMELALHEIEMLKKVSLPICHPNVACIIESWQEENKVYIVSEFIEGKELSKINLPSNDAFLIQSIVVDILFALLFIHGRGVVHADIKGENIMITDKDKSPVLVDLGVSCVMRQNESCRPLGWTIDYRAPEMTKTELATPQTDIYALGVTLSFVLKDKDITEELNDAIEGMLEPNPEDRPSVSQLIVFLAPFSIEINLNIFDNGNNWTILSFVADQDQIFLMMKFSVDLQRILLLTANHHLIAFTSPQKYKTNDDYRSAIARIPELDEIIEKWKDTQIGKFVSLLKLFK